MWFGVAIVGGGKAVKTDGRVSQSVRVSAPRVVS